MPQGFSIAIDGPVASGKGTVARVLAEKLNGFFMNTGGMYRAVALYGIENGVDIYSENAVAKILPEVHIEIENGIFLNGRDVSERIKAQDTDTGSSVVGVYRQVRAFLVRRQQEIGQEVIDKGQIVVAEGRDVATKIFPEAGIKIFLTASVEERAKRRQLQYRAKGIEKSTDELKTEIEGRDDRDSNRAIDPLQLKNPEGAGYWVVDNTNETSEETIERIVVELQKRGLIKNDQN